LAIKVFPRFFEATQYAKELSKKVNKTVSYGRLLNAFFVYEDDEVQSVDLSEEEVLDCLNDDYDYQDTQSLLTEELWDAAESYSRSEEDGWYYDDTDEGGWENSISSQSYD